MHEHSVIIAQPENASQLILLFHGVGSSADDLVPLGEIIAEALPGTAVISVDAPHPSTLGSGREWFSVVGITEQDRVARIASAMPLFRKSVTHWQHLSGVTAENTTLIGFSQGAIISLESTQEEAPTLAGQVISLAGRFATPVRQAPAGVRYHLIHGSQDGVVAPQFSQQAADAIRANGGSVTLDLLAGLGHAIDSRVLRLVLGYLG